MTEERFSALADAYGGDIARWPADEQADAKAWRVANAPRAVAILNEASTLDLMLGSAVVAAPGFVLRDRIVASARGPQTGAHPAVGVGDRHDGGVCGGCDDGGQYVRPAVA
jgi:hypothetical protein